MKRGWMLLVLMVVLCFSGVANASLTTIGTANYQGNNYNLIFEGDLGSQGLVWLDYTNAATTWQNQNNWASGLGQDLAVTLNPGYTTTIDWSTGWRLPITDESKANLSGQYGYAGPDGTGYHNYTYGYNMINSEMGHLYYVSLGNKGYAATDGTQPQDGYGLQNMGDFDQLQAAAYWSGTSFSQAPNFVAWYFGLGGGYQAPQATDIYELNYAKYALAVHPGEVSSVPIPGAVWLLGSGLIGLVGFRRPLRK